jgi:uncharacterized repeat protein (TIGR03806 family)
MKKCPNLFGLFVLTFVSALQLLASGPIERVPNTTLQIPLTLPTNFATVTLNVSLTNPITIATPPGDTNRVFILEKRGRIVVITNIAIPTRTIFMSITDRVTGSDTSVGAEEGLLGLAFHPGYATNRYFYVFYTGNDTTTAGGGRHDIVSRFTTLEANPNAGDPSSEVKIIRQRDNAGNHNGGDMHFGSEGYLYVSTGDEGGGDDDQSNSQNITKDLFSAILRIDVDRRPGNLTPNPHPAVTTNYLIPLDNPFIGATSFNGFAVNSNQVRTEFWAVGMRNPWRMSFDPDTGLLYCGDVGQVSREEIDIIEKGKNYGWTYFEGNLQRTNSLPAGFVHAPPLFDYPRGQGFAITGGRVYRGHNLPNLHGAYIYGDYGSGRIWALRHNGMTVTTNFLIATDDSNGSGVSGLSGFGFDPSNGDILYVDEQNAFNGRLKRIVYGSSTNQFIIPPTLADTGAFGDVANLTLQPGIVPYDLNVPFWSDNAIKTRWVSVPNTNLTIGFSAEGNWSFPTGTVWVKHFELELTNGVPESRKRLETRFIMKNAQGVYGITYRWGDSTTNATLVPDEGMDEQFVIDEGGGILRTQVWHYPSRVECNQCHTGVGGFALGFNTAQLNRAYDYGSATTNQIAALSLAGYFNTNVTGIHALRALAHSTDSETSLEYRVRSYLAANCAQCHQPGGPAQGALWDARIQTTTRNAGIVDGPLGNNSDTNLHVISRGSLSNSMILTRISKRGPGQMPPIASTVIDAQAVALVSAWITNDLPNYQTFAEWQMAHFNATNAPDAAPNADPDADGAVNELEFLTRTSPTNALERWQISVELSNDVAHVVFPQMANRAFEVHGRTNLLDSNSWAVLDIPANAPFFAISNRTGVVSEPVSVGSESKYYRARVIEP